MLLEDITSTQLSVLAHFDTYIKLDKMFLWTVRLEMMINKAQYSTSSAVVGKTKT